MDKSNWNEPPLDAEVPVHDAAPPVSVIERSFAEGGALPSVEVPADTPAPPGPVLAETIEPVAELQPLATMEAQNVEAVPNPQPVRETQAMASNFDYNRASEQAKAMGEQVTQSMAQATDQMRQQGEAALKQSQEAMAQVAERSRDAMDRGMKAFDDFGMTARGNADAWLAASRAAAQGLEQIVQQAAEFSRKTFEGATSAMRTMAAAKTPADVMQAQSEFARTQFDTLVGEFSKLSETMMRVTNDVFEPLSSRMSETAHKAGEAMKQGMTPPKM